MQRLQRRILLGEAASSAVREGLGDVDPELLGVFEEAFTKQRSLCFDYVDRFGAPSQREAECVAILLRHPAWYVVAWDVRKDAPRMFRMDRIRCALAGATLATSHSLATVIEIVCPVAEAADASWLGSPLGV
jgi:predicted DNA-binding transcriptional regulator YafY